MRYLVIVIIALSSCNLFAQKKGIKFYKQEDSIKYQQISMMMSQGRSISVINGKAIFKIVDSSYMNTAFNYDSLYQLLKEVPIYGYLSMTPNPDFCTLSELKQSTRKDTITHLSLSGKALKRLPIINILKCKTLKEIEITGASIRKIPWVLNWRLFGLDSLHRLNIYNYEGGKPFKFSKNTQLKRLVYRENPRAPFPLGIRKLKNIEELNLVRNDFKKEVTFNLGSFVRLKEVNLSYNAIDINNLTSKNNDTLESLLLRFCKLTEVGDGIGYFKNLKELQLSENKITAPNISPNISLLKELQILSFYNNELDSLPTSILAYPKLIELDLYHNQIDKIPSEISQLRQLKKLYLANNTIYSIPEEIGELTELEELYLKHNRISYLPNSLSKLSKITDFHINNNYLQAFPECILSFKNLQDLDVSFNNIHSLPPALLTLPNLKLLWMRGITFEARNQEEALSIKNTLEGLEAKGVKISVELD
ncbi:MAG: Leucine-rich repeat (LRR) protein [Marivirga sp.]|jgi:Leucine-rich repeat (LRR) protein